MPMTIAPVLLAFRSKLLLMCQQVTASAQDDSSARRDEGGDLKTVYNCVCVIRKLVVIEVLKLDIRLLTSVVNNESKSGPRTDLSGTPVESLTDEDRRPHTATNCSRRERYERSQFKITPSKPISLAITETRVRADHPTILTSSFSRLPYK